MSSLIVIFFLIWFVSKDVRQEIADRVGPRFSSMITWVGIFWLISAPIVGLITLASIGGN